MEPRINFPSNMNTQIQKKSELADEEISCKFFKSAKKLGDICIICKSCKKFISYDSSAILLNSKKENTIFCDDLAVTNAILADNYKIGSFKSKNTSIKYVFKEIQCISCKIQIGKFIVSSGNSRFLTHRNIKNVKKEKTCSNNSVSLLKNENIDFSQNTSHDFRRLYYSDELKNFLKRDFEFSSMNYKCFINEEKILYYDTNIYSPKRNSRLLDSMDSCFSFNKDHIDRVRHLFLPQTYALESEKEIKFEDKFYKEYLKLCSSIQYIISPIKMKLAFYNIFEKVFIDVDKKIKIIVIAIFKTFKKIKKIAQIKACEKDKISEKLQIFNNSIKEIEIEYC